MTKTQNAVASFPNTEYDITAFIFPNLAKAGGFNVTLRDDDSGEFVPVAQCGIQTIEAATAAAKVMADL